VNILTLDFETFFSDAYTLRKMTTESYVRDSRFEALGMGVQFNGGQRGWIPQHRIQDWLDSWFYVQYPDCAVLCHHAHFDCLILSHHYGIKPRFIYDTLSMARLQLGNHISVSLESLARHYGLEGKSVPYEKFRGKRAADIGPDLYRDLGNGCLHDVELTFDIFQRLAVGFPSSEYQTINLAVRAFTEPKLEGNVNEFAAIWTAEKERKQQLLRELGVTAKDLGSNQRFAELLAVYGIDAETKAGKAGDVFAFAKTDNFMQELLDSDDDDVRLLAEARIETKSNGELTRATRLGWMATRGSMCVYLAPFAAHTTRFGGGDKTNYQNMKRGSPIRKAHKAPAGYTVIKADRSQDECRKLNFIAEQWDVVERFASGVDPYVGIASKFYGRTITRDDPAERGVGKQLELSCGYGAGGPTIVKTARRGTYGPPVHLTDTQGLEARDLYRATHPNVVAYWKTAGRMISAIAGTNHPVQWGVMTVDNNVIWLPGGVPIWYHELHYYRDPESGEEYWRYRDRKGWPKLYGGKLTENVIQALSAVDMRETLVRIYNRTNISYVNQEHDAAVWIVPNALVTPFTTVVQEEMTRAPVWLPGIPLACEITTGETM
jgi:DNA polymerase